MTAARPGHRAQCSPIPAVTREPWPADPHLSLGASCVACIFWPLSVAHVGWGVDRILFHDLRLGIGPRRAAPVAWSDARGCRSASCGPGVTPNGDSNVSCEKTYVYFA